MKFSAFPFLPAAIVALSLVRAADASAADAKGTIDAFDATLLDTMKGADKLGYKGRYDKLAPVITQTYDLPLMARISVGPQWATLSADEQGKITEAFIPYFFTMMSSSATAERWGAASRTRASSGAKASTPNG